MNTRKRYDTSIGHAIVTQLPYWSLTALVRQPKPLLQHKLHSIYNLQATEEGHHNTNMSNTRRQQQALKISQYRRSHRMDYINYNHDKALA